MSANSDPPVYCCPAGVQSERSGKRVLLTTPQGGRVVIDRRMLQIWQQAHGRSRQEILDDFEQQGLPPVEVSAALGCLTRAGLLSLPEAAPPAAGSHSLPSQESARVSALIVSYNSLAWLPDCLASLHTQSQPVLEVVVVDNASGDGSADWLAENHPNVTLVRLSQSASLAAAINLGIEHARGDYILLLNPDVVLDPKAVSYLVDTAQSDPNCAAVAAKLRLLWAPAFLNGLGNLVGSLSWGTDIGLGHLDLGQFDQWNELPSACFAAALLPAQALVEVGPLDEGLPMYYEDSEWCYRARLLGHTVRPASQAVVYHAFSGRMPGEAESGLSASKRQRVVYGRLRFITRLLGSGYLLRFLTGYLLEDLLNGLVCLLRGRWEHLRAYLRAWIAYFDSLPRLRQERKTLQNHRLRTERELFQIQRNLPVPLIWRGLPVLTWDIVRNEYLPWVERGEPASPKMSPNRALAIWRVEGFAALAHRAGRYLLWKWMQP